MRQDQLTPTQQHAIRPSAVPLMLKVPFGLREGRMWSPKQVAAGKACGCVCPACQAPLVAKATDSRQRRPHFAHLADTDCRAGYETALHRRAKELIAEHLMVRLPAWDGEPEMPNPPVAIDDFRMRLYGRRVEFGERQATLGSVRLEESRGDYVPDVIAQDELGELLIEIKVSHAVDDQKRRRIQAEGGRLIEIDLSGLKPEQVSEEATLLHWVLNEPSNRAWLSCPPATDDWRESHRDLKLALAARNLEIAELRRVHAMRQAEQDAERLQVAAKMAEKAANREQFKAQIRSRLRHELEALPELVSTSRIQSLLEEYEARDSEEVEKLLQDVEPVLARHAIRICGSGSWLYQVHPVLWQAASYQRFVQGKSRGTQFNQQDVARWVMGNFGREEELYILFKEQYLARDAARKAGFRKFRISHWAFSDLENRQIPNFYAPINEFMERLVRAGIIECVSSVVGGLRVVRADGGD